MTWPAPGELAALRRRRDAAVVHLAQGRHAPGLRQLRQAIGGLARRSDWAHAADGALALAGAAPATRSRAGRAGRDRRGRQYARRSGRDGVLVDLATLSGEAWIDLARLDEAESVLATALAAARAARDPVARRGSVGGACALPLLARAVRRGRGGARRAGRRDMAALARAAHAACGAHRGGIARRQPRDVAGARRLASRASADGDRRRQRRRQLHGSPRASCGRRSGRRRARRRPNRWPPPARRTIRCEPSAAASFARRPSAGAAGTRLRSRNWSGCGGSMTTMPPALRARWELGVGARATATAMPQEIVAQRVAATGLGALALYASDPRGLPGAWQVDRSVRRRARRDPARLPGGGGRGGRA